jgi:protease secretion system membrane fusion protein
MVKINSNVASPYADKEDVKTECFYERLGLIIIATAVCGFLIWAALAPLDKGITAPGTVVVSGHRKTIQAPNNGTVEKVIVKEGDYVEAGALLIELSQTQASARYQQIRDKYLMALASCARLQAERDNAEAPVFPALLQHDEWQQQAAKFIAIQEKIFHDRRQALASELKASQHALEGLQYQTQSTEKSLLTKKKVNASLKQQLVDMQSLTNEHFFPRNRYRELERQQHEIQGQIEELAGQINANQAKEHEIEQHIKNAQAEYDKEVNTQLAQVENNISEYKNNMLIARYDLDNTHIVSSTSGVVMALNTLIPGSVLSAGEALMDIVPRNSPLMIDAQIGTDMIDKVSAGLTVDIMFTTLNQNKTPVITGYVTLVSPDRLINEHSGEPYYPIQIAVSDEGKKLLANEDIRPGMSVNVLVKTGSRSLLNYLFKPVLDRAQTALTEE